MSARKLVLNKERLVELTAVELEGVVGGTHRGCVTHNYSCEWCSVMTLPINGCLDTQAC